MGVISCRGGAGGGLAGPVNCAQGVKGKGRRKASKLTSSERLNETFSETIDTKNESQSKKRQ